MMAPSTLGTFLRAFTFGHVRQLEAVVPGGSLTRATVWSMNRRDDSFELSDTTEREGA